VADNLLINGDSLLVGTSIVTGTSKVRKQSDNSALLTKQV